MAGVPINFNIPGESAVASYSYTELVTRLGYVDFIPTCSISDNTNTIVQNLSTTTLDVGAYGVGTLGSSVRYSHPTGGAFSFTSPAFDSTRTVEGDFYLSFTSTASDSGASGGADITITLKKNTTTLGTATVKSALVNSNKTHLVKISVARTNINTGDTLNISMTVGNYYIIHHDPLERNNGSFAPAGGLGTFPATTAATNTTKCTLSVPFRLDL